MKTEQRAKRLQFSLRALLVAVAVFALLLGLCRDYYELSHRCDLQRRAMSQIAALGAKNWSYGTAPAAPQWLRSILGEEKFRDVTDVHLGDTSFTDQEICLLNQLPRLERLSLGSATVTEDSLAELKRLHPRLRIGSQRVDVEPQILKGVYTSESIWMPSWTIRILAILGLVLAIALVRYLYRQARRRREEPRLAV